MGDTEDDLATAIDIVLHCMGRCDDVKTGRIETAPSVMDKTFPRKFRNMTMRDAKDITKVMRVRLNEALNALERIQSSK